MLDGLRLPGRGAAKSQSVVALSTLESEYIAASDATREVIWLRRLLSSIGQLPNTRGVTDDSKGQTTTNTEIIDHDSPDAPPTKIFGDNQGAINMIKSGVIKSKSRHIAVKFHHCHSEYKEQKSTDYTYIPSADNLADIMTKPLPGPKHVELTRRIGIHGLDESANDKEAVMFCSCTKKTHNHG